MKEFRFEKPASLEEAAEILAVEPRSVKVLAGGTDLLVALRAGSLRPALFMDIKSIPGIHEIVWTQDGDLRIGAAVEVQRIHDDPRIMKEYPALAEGAGQIGSLQIRWRATIGGNLANASPCMDTAPPLLVLGARLCVAGPRGEREIPLESFFVDVKKTVLHPDEILLTIIVPRASAGTRSAFAKVKRVWGHDLALVNAAGALDPAKRVIRLAIGSCGVTPVLLPPLDAVDPEKADANEVGRLLAESALRTICPIDDVRASAEYRRDMAALLCRRVAATLLAKDAGRRP
jgi:CO/xanthine dehydrogenase FAD-binding subunit